MSATKEKWNYTSGTRVWVGKYKNSQNSLHWHSDCELVFVERGALDIACRGINYRLSDGMAMFIDSDSLHHIHAIDPESVVVTIVFDRSIINGFAEKTELCSPVLRSDYGIDTVYASLFRELTEKRHLYSFAASADVYRLMLDIFRTELSTDKKPSDKADAKLKSLFNEIQKNYNGYTLNDAAAFMNMNASYLSRFFAQKTGVHFTRYVNCVKIEKAVELLSGDHTVTEVADLCGFGTIRNFNRMFKLLTGYSPSDLPDGYSFIAPLSNDTESYANPTLVGCELLESSDLPFARS